MSVSAALGGSERVLFDFASRASAHGIEPLVLAPKDGPLLAALREAGVAVEVAPAPAEFLAVSQRSGPSVQALTTVPRGMKAWGREIRAAMARRGVTSPGHAVLYSNGFKAHLACAAVPGHPRVWHLHEFPPGGLGALWRLVAAGVPRALIANSEAVGRAWRLPALPAPETVLNGVDLERFKPGPRTGWVHEQLGLTAGARLIGMPAVFARWKGHFEVIAAFECMAQRVPEAHLVLAGGAIYDTDAERGYAHDMVRRVSSSLKDRIHFLKFQPEPWLLYPEFDLVVHYSTRPEPFGRVIVEAMACGVPVVAARAGGPMEIIEDGLSGWLVPPGEVQALADRIAAVMGSEDLAGRGQAARLRAEAAFSADRFAGQVARIMERESRR